MYSRLDLLRNAYNSRLDSYKTCVSRRDPGAGVGLDKLRVL